MTGARGGVDPGPTDGPAITADEVEARLLGRPASLSGREVSSEAAPSLVSARRLWHALGFQNVEDEAMFTDADREALQSVSRLVRDFAVDEDLALAMTRALARTADRLAVWQTQLVAESIQPPRDESLPGPQGAGPLVVGDAQVAAQAAHRLVELADEIEPLLSYVWRRHLSGAITRMLADADQNLAPTAPQRVVGFADLVNFTSLVRRMTERQLAQLVQRFEQLASDVITTHGGRVIKTVGDEVLFVHTDPAAAAAIALDLVDAMDEDDLMPEVRVAMAHGAVVSRLGDVFGTTVNRASRLTSVTPIGRVWVDEDLARRLGAVSGFQVRQTRRRSLRGIGAVVPFELRRSERGRRVEGTSGVTDSGTPLRFEP